MHTSTNPMVRVFVAFAAALALIFTGGAVFVAQANAETVPVSVTPGNGEVTATNNLEEPIATLTFYAGDNDVAQTSLAAGETKVVALDTTFLPSDIFWDGTTESGLYFDSAGVKYYITYTPEPEEPTNPTGPPANAGPPEGMPEQAKRPDWAGPPADNPGQGQGRGQGRNNP